MPRGLVICNGVMRSGSTWSYAVAQALMARMGEKLNIPFRCGYLNVEELDAWFAGIDWKESQIACWKSHFLSPSVKAAIASGVIGMIVTVRDPLDCVASRRVFQEDEDFDRSVALVDACYRDVVPLIRHGIGCVIDYEVIVGTPWTAVWAISRLLNIALLEEHCRAVADTVTEELRAIADGAQESESSKKVMGHLVDPRTQVHHNHFQGGEIGKWREILTPSEQAEAQECLMQWSDWYKTWRRNPANVVTQAKEYFEQQSARTVH